MFLAFQERLYQHKGNLNISRLRSGYVYILLYAILKVILYIIMLNTIHIKIIVLFNFSITVLIMLNATLSNQNNKKYKISIIQNN